MKKPNKKLRNLKNSNYMVTEIIGTMLLLGIVVSVFSSIYGVVLSTPVPNYAPNVTIVSTVEGSNIIIEHLKGDPLGLDTKINIEGELPFTAEDYLNEEAKSDDYWNIGERIVRPFEYNISRKEVEICAYDIDSNSQIFSGILNIQPECDLGVEIDVDTKFFAEGRTDFLITVSNYRTDIWSTDATIQITLPYNMYIIKYFTDRGTFDQHSGVWEIDELNEDESVTITIWTYGIVDNIFCEAEIIQTSIPNIDPINNIAFLEVE